MTTSKYCPTCKITKPTIDFHLKYKNRDNRWSSKCKSCSSIYHKERIKSMSEEEQALYKEKLRTKQKNRRANRAVAIYVDSRQSDKVKLRENDLTMEFIEKEIKKPCFYCLSVNLTMTLDRIDNKKGHTMDNVNPSCIRCNMMRRDMPYAAWLALSENLPQIVESGLFENWTGAVHRLKN